VRLARETASGGRGDRPAYRLTVDGHGTPVPLLVGDGVWLESSLAVAGCELPVAASGGWDAQGCFAADLRIVETPHTIRVRTRGDGTVHLAWRELPQVGADPLLLATRGPAMPPQT
jgi:hypothetical protein